MDVYPTLVDLALGAPPTAASVCSTTASPLNCSQPGVNCSSCAPLDGVSLGPIMRRAGAGAVKNRSLSQAHMQHNDPSLCADSLSNLCC